jgi:hypothetical protein
MASNEVTRQQNAGRATHLRFFNRCDLFNSCGVFVMQRLIDFISLAIFVSLSTVLLLAVWGPTL